jgi:WD40 repeat protein
VKIRPIILNALAAFAVLVGVAFLFYHLGSRHSQRELAAMQEEMDRLIEAEKDAAIVKRVSQQMEDIAYQQKAISDQQRDRAEEQSLLATRNAERAEMESRAAHEAEKKANAAADVAEKERANAERQQMIAVEQRDEATYARNVADTLNRRTQARSLAVSSQVRREAGEPEVADLLAYASWYFLKNNRGNQYFADTFKSLALATNGSLRYKVKENGAVNAISQVPGTPGQCVVVTNYGEVEWLTAGPNRIDSTPLLFNSAYDFRDVLVIDGKIYALSVRGPLCILDFNGEMKEIPLPQENYFKMLPMGGGLLLAGRQSISWYSDGKITGSETLGKTLSALVNRNGTICLFFKDGSYAEMDATGNVEEKKPYLPNVVTAAYYDEDTDCLLLGTEDGTVYPVNKYNRVMETLAAHKSRCVSITMLGSVVVTGGYDKTAYIWNMDNLMFESGMSFREELNEKNTVRRAVNSSKIPTEWLVPVDYTYDGWTLSVCGDADGKTVWIGTSAGNVILLNSSADDMAHQLYNKINRNLTQQEWTRYVGASIPYMTFK